MKDDLSQNLRLYINLDMNHVDIDPERGDSGFDNSQSQRRL